MVAKEQHTVLPSFDRKKSNEDLNAFFPFRTVPNSIILLNTPLLYGFLCIGGMLV